MPLAFAMFEARAGGPGRCRAQSGAGRAPATGGPGCSRAQSDLEAPAPFSLSLEADWRCCGARAPRAGAGIEPPVSSLQTGKTQGPAGLAAGATAVGKGRATASTA